MSPLVNSWYWLSTGAPDPRRMPKSRESSAGVKLPWISGATA